MKYLYSGSFFIPLLLSIILITMPSSVLSMRGKELNEHSGVVDHLFYYCKHPTHTFKTTRGRDITFRALASEGLQSLFKKLPITIYDAQFKEPDTGNTALHYAVENNLENMVGYLIDKGADIDTPNNQGITPWKLAVTNHKLQLFPMWYHSSQFAYSNFTVLMAFGFLMGIGACLYTQWTEKQKKLLHWAKRSHIKRIHHFNDHAQQESAS
jgi:hypothetical protein